jgi:hypothetical protein
MDTIKRWFSCFKGHDDMVQLNQQLYNVSKKYKISILPIVSGFNLDNLYPLTDQVQFWNIFIVGRDKTYILASCKNIKIPNTEQLLNKTADGILPDELREFFDPIWDKTLKGSQLQFYIVFNSSTYFVNTYPFYNDRKRVIGAIMFLRLFETMPDVYYMNNFPVDTKDQKRISIDSLSTVG